MKQQEEDFVCFSTGLPLEEPPEGPEKVLGALSLAMDAQDAGMAAAKGVRVAAGAPAGLEMCLQGGAAVGRGREHKAWP